MPSKPSNNTALTVGTQKPFLKIKKNIIKLAEAYRTFHSENNGIHFIHVGPIVLKIWLFKVGNFHLNFVTVCKLLKRATLSTHSLVIFAYKRLVFFSLVIFMLNNNSNFFQDDK